MTISKKTSAAPFRNTSRIDFARIVNRKRTGRLR